MFIRKTRITHPDTKKIYYNFQLIESVRTERGPRQRILLNLGADLELDKQESKLLANRIEEILTGINSFLSYPARIERLARKYASELLRHLSDQPKQEMKGEEEEEYQTIDVHTIEQSEPRTVGVEHVLLHCATQLQIPKKLREMGFSEREASLALGTIIGRATFPASERATHAWLEESSGLGELIDFNFQKTSSDHLYQISDRLLDHKEELERHLEVFQQQVHGYQSTMILYDLTNTYMEGQAKGNPKAKHGRSKEKRTDSPLITLGLVINEYGFARRSSFFPGNISEPSTLEQIVKLLHDPEDLFKPTVILDAGIATEENLKWLRDHHYTYIVSARQKAPSLEIEGSMDEVGDLGKNVKAAFIQEDGIEEKWLYCESEAKLAVATQMRELFQKRFEEELKKANEGLGKPKGRKKYIKVLERIGRLREKHRHVSGCYEIHVEPSSDGLTALHITWKLQSAKLSERLNGYYFLRTNLIKLSPKELWNLYNTLRTVEDAFRFMKSSLGMRPVYHQKEHRVDGHLWITLLAYHLIQSCLYQLRKQGLSHNWETVRNWLSKRVRVTMQAKTKEGKILYHRSTTNAEENQKGVYRSLGIPTQILKSKKVIL